MNEVMLFIPITGSMLLIIPEPEVETNICPFSLKQVAIIFLLIRSNVKFCHVLPDFLNTPPLFKV